MAHLTSTDMNDALIAFNSRWSLDGDYLRCTECKRPQIASKADQAFVHHAECTKPHADHTHPWHDLRNLLRGLPEQPARAKEVKMSEQCKEPQAHPSRCGCGEAAETDWRNALRTANAHTRQLMAERDALHAEAEALRAENAALRESSRDVRALAASLYQACGAYNMPERILDALSAAANGEPFTHMIDGLLPCVPPSDQEVRSLLSADDVRDACANAVSVFAEEANADQCREVAEYMREVLLAQIAHRQAQRQ